MKTEPTFLAQSLEHKTGNYVICMYNETLKALNADPNSRQLRADAEALYAEIRLRRATLLVEPLPPAGEPEYGDETSLHKAESGQALEEYCDFLTLRDDP